MVEGENDCSTGCGKLADTETENQGPMCHECYEEMCERIIERKDQDLAQRAEACALVCEERITGVKSDLHRSL